MSILQKMLGASGESHLTGAPEGFDALILADLARALAAERGKNAHILHIARDDQRLAALQGALGFFAPQIRLIHIPAWDCLPYDRVSPNPAIASARLSGLRQLLELEGSGEAALILTTVSAVLQRVPARKNLQDSFWSVEPGNVVDVEKLRLFLQQNGYEQTDIVMEPGEYAVRGGIIDVFSPDQEDPVRLDLFGDTLESIRSFDAASQRTKAQLKGLELGQVSDIVLTKDAVSRFRTSYVAQFGAVTKEDPLYESISAGKRFQGMEHWLPLFHDRLETVLDYVPDSLITLDPLSAEAITERCRQIGDYYQARIAANESQSFGAAPYAPLPPQFMYLDEDEWAERLKAHVVGRLTPFEEPPASGITSIRLEGKQGRNFAAERAEAGRNVFDAVAGHVRDLQARGKRVLIACWSQGSAARMAHVLRDHDLAGCKLVSNWQDAQALKKDAPGLIVLQIEHGFETPDLAIIGEQDILGDRLVRPRRSARAARDVLTEIASLNVGDLVVHVNHGIGRFEGLRSVTALGAPHDCLELVYHGGDKLYLPVENIELLTRYGSGDALTVLDRLGSAAWQARKSRMKKRLLDMAEGLIQIAAARHMRKAPVFTTTGGMYDEFAAAFPFVETEDQDNAISQVLEDLTLGKPMDRLVCGDVGFGKTEVALRAAFAATLEGYQVAVVVPTTLLARQHTRSFTSRFANFPVRIAQASRLVGSAELARVKAGLKSGEIDIVIGTHALLGKSVKFKNLGLLIVDEEQHFGVAHKESLKKLRNDVHVLTLTATPIPRTLQLALTGVRELSLIASPPVDRLAIRTFISPFDPVVVRETLLREHYRGGQSFYVCPRISDLDEVAAFLREQVPEVKFATAHGQMPPAQLEDIMNAFYDGKFDVLLSTTIVESGLDIPTANTLVVHRADMFGLAQLYQLRGRVGRSKLRAYALMTVPARKRLTKTAEKRLRVLQSLDTLGAGFSLASHDLDIRGAGNLLGEEQSGHIKEVGFELYQQMLEEAVATLRDDDETAEVDWSPQISVGTAVLIPESYVPDLQLRLNLYRRLSSLNDEREIDGFAAELI
ncbi:MAG TPA: transcription-repair coupling factor, partial [Rhizobiales bacterium]|nr:transcription-repair coupling factor [Hyphomicrobiales bacterium]